MSRSKFIDQKDAKTSFTKQLPAGSYGKFQFTLEGITDTGQTLTNADLGTVIFSDRKGEMFRVPIGMINELSDLKGGYPAKVSGGAAAAERVVAYLGMGYSGYPNVLQLRDNNEVSIRYEPSSTIATKFGANAVTIRIEGWINRQVAQTYRLSIIGQNQQAAAAGQITDNLTGENLVALLLRDSGSVVTSINSQIGDEVILDNTPYAIIGDETNIQNKIEAAGNPLNEVAISETGIQAGTFNSGGRIDTTFSGAGTLELWKVAFAWLPEAEVQRNIAQVNAYLRSL